MHGCFRWNTTIWSKPTLCWSCKLSMGMVGSLILHLVCWTSLGCDLLLLPSMFFFFFFLLLFYSLLITPRSWQWRSQKFGLGGKIKDKIESKNLILKKLININNKVNNQLYANEILIHNLT